MHSKKRYSNRKNYEMKQELSAGIIVYYIQKSASTSKRHYLLLYYRSKYWDFPKGKIEGNETYQEAALRELKEETGLTLTLHKGFEQSISYFFKDLQGVLVDKTVVYFVGEATTEHVVLSPEHTDFIWLPLKESLARLTYANAQQVLSMADHFIDSLQHTPEAHND